MTKQPAYESQLVDGQDAMIRRLRGVRFCGLWENGRPQFNDDAGLTGTGFTLSPGETIGQALDRVDRDWRAETLSKEP